MFYGKNIINKQTSAKIGVIPTLAEHLCVLQQSPEIS